MWILWRRDHSCGTSHLSPVTRHGDPGSILRAASAAICQGKLRQQQQLPVWLSWFALTRLILLPLQSLAHSPGWHQMSHMWGWSHVQEFILCPPPGDRVRALYSMSRRQTDFQYLLAVENEEFYHRGHKHEWVLPDQVCIQPLNGTRQQHLQFIAGQFSDLRHFKHDSVELWALYTLECHDWFLDSVNFLKTLSLLALSIA